MIVGLMLVIGGLVLLTGSLYLIPALGKQLEKLAKWLGGFQALIGVVAIVVALIEWEDLYSIVLVIVGLILAVSIMAMLPAVGKYIAKFVKALGGVQTAVGVIALIGGIWNLID
jgi:uncharacterized membrane protein HdeD (DUF308 family)